MNMKIPDNVSPQPKLSLDQLKVKVLELQKELNSGTITPQRKEQLKKEIPQYLGLLEIAKGEAEKDKKDSMFKLMSEITQAENWIRELELSKTTVGVSTIPLKKINNVSQLNKNIEEQLEAKMRAGTLTSNEKDHFLKQFKKIAGDGRRIWKEYNTPDAPSADTKTSTSETVDSEKIVNLERAQETKKIIADLEKILNRGLFNVDSSNLIIQLDKNGDVLSSGYNDENHNYIARQGKTLNNNEIENVKKQREKILKQIEILNRDYIINLEKLSLMIGREKTELFLQQFSYENRGVPNLINLQSYLLNNAEKLANIQNEINTKYNEELQKLKAGENPTKEEGGAVLVSKQKTLETSPTPDTDPAVVASTFIAKMNGDEEQVPDTAEKTSTEIIKDSDKKINDAFENAQNNINKFINENTDRAKENLNKSIEEKIKDTETSQEPEEVLVEITPEMDQLLENVPQDILAIKQRMDDLRVAYAHAHFRHKQEEKRSATKLFNWATGYNKEQSLRDKELADQYKTEYEEAKKEYLKKLSEHYKNVIKQNESDPEKTRLLTEKVVHEKMFFTVLDERQTLLETENNLEEQEKDKSGIRRLKKWYKELSPSKQKQLKYALISVGAVGALGTLGFAGFTGGAIGVATKLGSMATGIGAGMATRLGVSKRFDFFINQDKSELEKETNALHNRKFSSFEDLMSELKYIEEKQNALFEKKLIIVEKELKKKRYSRVAGAAIGIGAALGANSFFSGFSGSEVVPNIQNTNPQIIPGSEDSTFIKEALGTNEPTNPLGDTIVEINGERIVKTDTLVNDLVQDNTPPIKTPQPTITTPEPTITPEPIKAPVIPETSELTQEAIVRKGEGITHALKRQIISDPEMAKSLGYQEGMDIKDFAGKKAFTIAKESGYIADGNEVRIAMPDKAGYQLSLDANGKPVVTEYFDGKIIETHSNGTNTDLTTGKEAYEYIDKKSVVSTSSETTTQPLSPKNQTDVLGNPINKTQVSPTGPLGNDLENLLNATPNNNAQYDEFGMEITPSSEESIAFESLTQDTNQPTPIETNTTYTQESVKGLVGDKHLEIVNQVRKVGTRGFEMIDGKELFFYKAKMNGIMVTTGTLGNDPFTIYEFTNTTGKPFALLDMNNNGIIDRVIQNPSAKFKNLIGEILLEKGKENQFVYDINQSNSETSVDITKTQGTNTGITESLTEQYYTDGFRQDVQNKFNQVVNQAAINKSTPESIFSNTQTIPKTEESLTVDLNSTPNNESNVSSKIFGTETVDPQVITEAVNKQLNETLMRNFGETDVFGYRVISENWTDLKNISAQTFMQEGAKNNLMRPFTGIYSEMAQPLSDGTVLTPNGQETVQDFLKRRLLENIKLAYKVNG